MLPLDLGTAARNFPALFTPRPDQAALWWSPLPHCQAQLCWFVLACHPCSPSLTHQPGLRLPRISPMPELVQERHQGDFGKAFGVLHSAAGSHAASTGWRRVQNQCKPHRKSRKEPLRHHLLLGRVCSLSSGLTVEWKDFFFSSICCKAA